MTTNTLEITLLNDKLNMEDVLEAMESANVEDLGYKILVGTEEDFIEMLKKHFSSEGGNALNEVPAYNMRRYVPNFISERSLEEIVSFKEETNKFVENLIGSKMDEFVEEISGIYGFGSFLNNVDGKEYEIEIKYSTYYYIHKN